MRRSRESRQQAPGTPDHTFSRCALAATTESIVANRSIEETDRDDMPQSADPFTRVVIEREIIVTRI
jgi:hypothetical protein